MTARGLPRAGALIAAAGCVVVALSSCSSTTANVTIPVSASNASPAKATAALCALGLRPVYVGAPSLHQADTGVNGYWVKLTDPKPGSHVSAGSVVDLTLVPDYNLGGLDQPQRQPAVPDVTGLDINQALFNVTKLGLLANVITASPTGSLLVTRESPAPGATVRGGSTVTLQVGRAGSQGCP
jgi:beta-lactam-binding protein with PASTA domain